MSGFSDFTWWIKSKAGYAIHDGKKKEIKDGSFISAPGHNEDDFVIHFKDGSISKSFEGIDFEELSSRHKN